MGAMQTNPCGAWPGTPMAALGMQTNPRGGGRGGRVFVGGGGWPWGGYYGWPYYGYGYGYPGYYWPYGGSPYAAAYSAGATTQDEIDRLRRRVSELEDEIARLRRTG